MSTSFILFVCHLTYTTGISKGFGFLEFKSVSDAQDWMDVHRVFRRFLHVLQLSPVCVFLKITRHCTTLLTINSY